MESNKEQEPIIIYCIKQFSDAGVPRGDTIGFFTDLNMAKSSVAENSCDMGEGGYYKYAVIFPVREGLYNYPSPDSERWYAWVKEMKQYIPCCRPTFMEHWALCI